jgi:hypothetical protein
MSMSDSPKRVTIVTDGAGAKITVGGVEISDAVISYQIEHNQGSLPTVLLVTRSPASELFDGLASVGVAVAQAPAEMVAEFLTRVDPAILERAALDRTDLDGGKHEVTAAIMRTLTEWAQGKGA